MAKRFTVEAIFKGIDRITRPISRMQNKISQFTRATRRQMDVLGKRLDKTNAKFKSLGVAGLAAGAGLALAGKEIIGVGAEFDQAITNASANFDNLARNDVFDKLKNAAKEWGEQTEFSATEAANALNFFAKAGLDPDTAILLLPKALDAATASSMDLATSTDIITDSMGLLGLASETQEDKVKSFAIAADFMTATAKASNQTVGQLFETFKQSAPLVKQLGVGMEELGVLTAVLANNGIKAEKSGVALKNILSNIQAPTEKGAKAFKALGVTTTEMVDGILHARKPIEILMDIMTGLGKLDPGKQGPLVFDLFGKIGLAGALTLGKTTRKEVDRLTEKISQYHGTTERMSKFMRDTLQKDFIGLGSVIEGVKIAITDLSGPALRGLILETKTWILANKDLIATNISGFIEGIIENLPAIISTLKTIVSVMIALKGLSIIIGIIQTTATAIGLLTTAVKFMSLAFAANPIGIAIGGAALLIVAVDALLEKFPELGNAWAKLTGRIQSDEIFGKGINPAFNAAAQAVGGDKELNRLISINDEDLTAEDQALLVKAREASGFNLVQDKQEVQQVEVTLKADAGTSAKVTKKSNNMNLGLSGGFAQ